jgi:hypothetical protein
MFTETSSQSEPPVGKPRSPRNRGELIGQVPHRAPFQPTWTFTRQNVGATLPPKGRMRIRFSSLRVGLMRCVTK